MAIIAAFTLYFFYANRRQRNGKKVIEGTVSLDLMVPHILWIAYNN